MSRLCLMVLLLLCLSPALAGASQPGGTCRWDCVHQTHGGPADLPVPCASGLGCPSMAPCMNGVLTGPAAGLPAPVAGTHPWAHLADVLHPMTGPETDVPPPRSRSLAN